MAQTCITYNQLLSVFCCTVPPIDPKQIWTEKLPKLGISLIHLQIKSSWKYIYMYKKYIHHYSSQWSKCQPSCSIKKQTYHAHQKVMRVLASQLHEFDKQHLQTLHVINLNPHLETHIRVFGASCSPAYCDLRCCSWTLKVISTMTRRYYWTIPAVPECRDCRIFATCPLSLSRVVPRSVWHFFRCVCVCGSSL